MSYPDIIYCLALHLKNNDISDILPVAINTTGNILTDYARNVIESQFHCKVFDSYSCEGSATIFECPTHFCYHTSMEYAISEYLDENDEPVEHGKARLITTDLHNYAMPFIRYV